MPSSGWSYDENSEEDESSKEEESEEDSDEVTACMADMEQDSSDGPSRDGDDDGEFDFEEKDQDSGSETEWEKNFHPVKLPESLNFPPLPSRYADNVDSRIKEDVPFESREQYGANSHPLMRRRYFVYKDDRMKGGEYNLEKDDITPNYQRAGRTEADDIFEKDADDVLEDPIKEFADCRVRN